MFPDGSYTLLVWYVNIHFFRTIVTPSETGSMQMSTLQHML